MKNVDKKFFKKSKVVGLSILLGISVIGGVSENIQIYAGKPKVTSLSNFSKKVKSKNACRKLIKAKSNSVCLNGSCEVFVEKSWDPTSKLETLKCEYEILKEDDKQIVIRVSEKKPGNYFESIKIILDKKENTIINYEKGKKIKQINFGSVRFYNIRPEVL